MLIRCVVDVAMVMMTESTWIESRSYSILIRLGINRGKILARAWRSVASSGYVPRRNGTDPWNSSQRSWRHHDWRYLHTGRHQHWTHQVHSLVCTADNWLFPTLQFILTNITYCFIFQLSKRREHRTGTIDRCCSIHCRWSCGKQTVQSNPHDHCHTSEQSTTDCHHQQWDRGHDYVVMQFLRRLAHANRPSRFWDNQIYFKKDYFS